MTEFTINVVRIIKSIPKGKVCTYGTIAMLAGNPRGARQVSWTLRTQTTKEQLPWYRVIGSGGKISIKEQEGYELQKALLESEGVSFDLQGRIDLNVYCWSGKDHS